MTKAQIKQLQMAATYLQDNNTEVFLRLVQAMLRAAMTDKQIAAIKEAAFDLQFSNVFVKTS
jgi:hypothetical protein